MKRLIYILASLSIILVSCEKYEDYLYDFEYSTVYFPIQQPIRTIVSNDNMELNIGVVLGGKRTNDVEEKVNFMIDAELFNNVDIFPTPPPFTILPDNYYTLSNKDEMFIKAGTFQGLVKITLNKEKFTNDPMALTNTYALPLIITESTTDSILKSKMHTVLVIKYVNELHGHYYHMGRDIIYDTSNEPIDTIIYSNESLISNEIWDLVSAGPDSVNTSGIGHLRSSNGDTYAMNLKVDAEGKISYTNLSGSKIQTVVGHESRFEEGDNSFYLKYQYTDELGQLHMLNDTLRFRNDGIGYEEW